jgi:hypothetical protein
MSKVNRLGDHPLLEMKLFLGPDGPMVRPKKWISKGGSHARPPLETNCDVVIKATRRTLAPSGVIFSHPSIIIIPSSFYPPPSVAQPGGKIAPASSPLAALGRRAAYPPGWALVVHTLSGTTSCEALGLAGA